MTTRRLISLSQGRTFLRSSPEMRGPVRLWRSWPFSAARPSSPSSRSSFNPRSQSPRSPTRGCITGSCVCPPTRCRAQLAPWSPIPRWGDLGEFDNDQYFSIRLMPHPPLSESATDQDKRDFTASVTTDKFQGQELLGPAAWDLPYADPVASEERYYLHCEAEGNFWQAMKDYAAVAGLATAGGAAAGGAAGAAAGCAIGGWFGPIGCAIGAFFGALAGAGGGAAAAGYLVATVAFHSDPGNVEDANVGDKSLGPIKEGDRVLVHGHQVYDGFHEGWHELHPLLAVMKIPDYLEQNPAVVPYDPSLTPADILKGLSSPAFLASAKALRQKWCERFQLPQDPGVHILQQQPQNRWTIHPAIDGCTPADPAPPPIH